MNDVILKEQNPLWFIEESTELNNYSQGCLAAYVFDLVDRKLQREQKDIVSSIASSIPAVSVMVEGLKKNQILKVFFSEEVKEKIADGTYRLMKQQDSDGIFKAVVTDSKGKIKELANLRVEDISKGVDLVKLTSAMQGMAIQQQLRDISIQLEDMSQIMEDVLIGQHNDRLAMFYSGEAIYRETLGTKDENLRKSLISSSIISLTNASSSLKASLPNEIRSIVDKYDAEKGRFVGIKYDKLKSTMFLINSSFQTIHKSEALKAAIYYNEREYDALVAVLSNYQTFLERTLTESDTNVLYYADQSEKSIDGIWSLRKNDLPMRIERTKELLSRPTEFSLEVAKEELI